MAAEKNTPGNTQPEGAEHGNGWARSSAEILRQRREDPASIAGSRRGSGPRSRVSQIRLEEAGITWDSDAVEWSLLQRTSVERVRARFRASLPEYIWDAAALEGNPYTLPEVQTLLEGITVTGHRIADQDQILALNDGFNLVDELVGRGLFRLDKTSSDQIHAKIAVHEAIESGHFRGEGHVDGGGLVSIGELGTYRASAPGKNGATLKGEFGDLTSYLLEDVEDPREQALAYFCAATRRQFYFDGNKRTAKLMMAGHLMANGYDAISISATRQLEFNQLLAPMFDNGDATEMMQFIIDSRPE